MASDYDKQQWQAEQAARDAALDKQREKERKARERSARNAQRKLERLQLTLRDNDEISDFEAEFADSVTERLEQFGSAFHDLEKGRPGDALSFAQKRVVSQMNRKVKDLKKSRRQSLSSDDGEKPSADSRPRPRPRSSFKSKKKPKWSPRVRQLDDDFGDDDFGGDGAGNDDLQRPGSASVFIPERAPDVEPSRPPVGKPFLRIVSNKDA